MIGQRKDASQPRLSSRAARSSILVHASLIRRVGRVRYLAQYGMGERAASRCTLTNTRENDMYALRSGIAGFAFAAVLAAGGVASAEQMKFKANLSGAEEVPPVETSATGTTGPAFSPGSAGPWKCAAVASPLRPEYSSVQVSVLVSVS